MLRGRTVESWKIHWNGLSAIQTLSFMIDHVSFQPVEIEIKTYKQHVLVRLLSKLSIAQSTCTRIGQSNDSKEPKRLCKPLYSSADKVAGTFYYRLLWVRIVVVMSYHTIWERYFFITKIFIMSRPMALQTVAKGR